MAEMDTSYLINAAQHGDIRREIADSACELGNQHGDIRREISAAACTLGNQNGDLRREGAEHTNEIVKEGLKESFNIRGDIKDTRYDLSQRIESSTDRVTDQGTKYYIADQAQQCETARDLATLKMMTDAQTQRMFSELRGVAGQATSAVNLEGQRTALGFALLSKDVVADGQKTRDLINDMKYHDLNRTLVERHTELLGERDCHRHWKHAADQSQYQGQWAALQSQIQAFASQLQETRQGMVNFGTMAGVGQTSTSNNVR